MSNLLYQANVLCLLVDIQEKLFPAIAKNDMLLKNSLFLLKGLNILEIPIIATVQYSKGLGNTIHEISNNIQLNTTFEKNEFSAFLNPTIKTTLAQSDKKQIIVIGIEAHICVLQTCIHLQRHGYEVFVPHECVGSRQESNTINALNRMQQSGIIISNAESCLFEMMESKAHPKFKEISQLLKSF